MNRFLLLTMVCWPWLLNAQRVHAHNDYEQPIPFWQAYHAGAGSIEVDVWMAQQQIWVAHDSVQLTRKFETLYGIPLLELAQKNQLRSFQLVIDLKSHWNQVWPVLHPWLESNQQLWYPKGPVKLVFSGAMPESKDWANLPTYVYFDGRPQKTYSDEAWQRIAMVSDSFTRYVRWNGKGIPTERERLALERVIQEVHQKNRPIRFWATPDDRTAWIYLTGLGVDFLNSDRVVEASQYLQKRDQSSWIGKEPYPVYQPNGRANQGSIKRVIFMIGDGMGLAQISAATLANQGKSNLMQMPIVGLSMTRAADSEVTDSAAGATAMATGEKANNRAIGWKNGHSLEPRLPKIAQKLKWKTGVVTLGDWTDATPAAFFASQPDRGFQDAIALDFVKNPLDLLVGSGEDRTNRLNIRGSLPQHGTTFSSLPSLVIRDEYGQSKSEGRPPLVNLLDSCFQLLGNHPFFLVVEGAQIDYGGHANDLPGVLEEMADFDQGVGKVLAYADQHPGTLVLVTADHETGGFTLLSGDQSTGHVEGHFSTQDHSGSWVPVLAYGSGSELFGGIYPNIEIYHRLKKWIETSPK